LNGFCVLHPPGRDVVQILSSISSIRRPANQAAGIVIAVKSLNLVLPLRVLYSLESLVSSIGT
jgi:hypothetical protein